jgi:hypothetical protein
MVLTKYPVITNEGEYLVDISKERICFDVYQWVVEIYVKNEKKTLFRRKRFKRVYQFETGWINYREYAQDLVGLAKEAVKRYEENVVILNRNFEYAVKEFEAWDGRVYE